MYWGTAWGEVHSYNVRTGNSHRIPLVEGCSVVSSPLVLTVDGREVVVVGIKPTHGQSAGNCQTTGKVYAVWGLDESGDTGKTAFDIGGWATPSPVSDGTPNGVIMGSDGGGVVRLKVEATGDPSHPYALIEKPWTTPCPGCGFAGNFTVYNGAAYWVDTAGVLRARDLRNGNPALPDIDLAARVKEKNPGPAGTPIAFTNTSPAVDPKTGILYITLRNYWPVNDQTQLRSSSLTGSAGAIVALNATTGETLWAKTMPLQRDPYDIDLNDAGSRVSFPDPESLNTNPLLLPSLGAVVVGDVNGNIHSLDLATGEPLRIFTWGDHAYSWWNMLPDGKQPERSQSAGARSQAPAPTPAPPAATWARTAAGPGWRRGPTGAPAMSRRPGRTGGWC